MFHFFAPGVWKVSLTVAESSHIKCMRLYLHRKKMCAGGLVQSKFARRFDGRNKGDEPDLHEVVWGGQHGGPERLVHRRLQSNAAGQ